MTRMLSLFAITVLLALAIGIMIFIIGKKSSRKQVLVALAIFLFTFLGCFFSVFQTNEHNTGCTPLPNEFTEEDLVGIWYAGSPSYPKSSDTLVIRKDGKYKQIIELEFHFVNFESDWQSWRFERRTNGTGYLHLEGFRDCAVVTEHSCEWVNDGSIPQADVCESKWMEPDPVGESVLVVRGYSFTDPNEEVLHPFTLTLFRGFESSPWSYNFVEP